MKNYGKIDAEVNALSDTIWDMATKVWTFAELGFRELKSSGYEPKEIENIKVWGTVLGGKPFEAKPL